MWADVVLEDLLPVRQSSSIRTSQEGRRKRAGGCARSTRACCRRRATRRPGRRDETGRGSTAAEEKKIKSEEARRHRAPVAGFDLVFSPVKSAALLWALDERAWVRDAVKSACETSASGPQVEMLKIPVEVLP
jgi:hypothetical protein